MRVERVIKRIVLLTLQERVWYSQLCRRGYGTLSQHSTLTVRCSFSHSTE